ncbi:hypothetical protein [Pseudobacillus badius]|uniref:hypothetical protein n=1 Tax=Bacillus badius TaxID=1455 RepID=UPI0007B3E768|nr:hypothetical protein [Bacillus badius]KZR57895.1 hypothetical protein A3781_19150 [Bacillus badius]
MKILTGLFSLGLAAIIFMDTTSTGITGAGAIMLLCLIVGGVLVFFTPRVAMFVYLFMWAAGSAMAFIDVEPISGVLSTTFISAIFILLTVSVRKRV